MNIFMFVNIHVLLCVFWKDWWDSAQLKRIIHVHNTWIIQFANSAGGFIWTKLHSYTFIHIGSSERVVAKTPTSSIIHSELNICDLWHLCIVRSLLVPGNHHSWELVSLSNSQFSNVHCIVLFLFCFLKTLEVALIDHQWNTF